MASYRDFTNDNGGQLVAVIVYGFASVRRCSLGCDVVVTSPSRRERVLCGGCRRGNALWVTRDSRQTHRLGLSPREEGFQCHSRHAVVVDH